MENRKITIEYIIALIILITILIIPVSTQPADIIFGVENAKGNQNSYAIVPVNIANVQNGPIISVTFGIIYNRSIINIIGVQRGDLTSNWSGLSYFDSGGRTYVSIYGSNNENSIQNGTSSSIALINFSVIGAPGSTSEINLSDIQLSRPDYNIIAPTPKNGTFTITGLTSIEIFPPIALLNVGETKNITATAKDESGAPMAGVGISWIVNNLSVGTVTSIKSITDSAGNATITFVALNPGTAMVNASNGSVKGTALVTVNKIPPYLSTIAVSPSTKTLYVGDNFTFTASPKDQDGNPITVTLSWSSSNSTMGTVDPSGKFNASNPGTAMVNASNGSVKGTAIVTVNKVLTSPIINFLSPTPENKSVLRKSSITIRIKSSEPLVNVLLEWDGINETVICSGTDCSFKKNYISFNNHTFRVHGKNSVNVWNATEMRRIIYIKKIRAGINIIQEYGKTGGQGRGYPYWYRDIQIQD